MRQKVDTIETSHLRNKLRDLIPGLPARALIISICAGIPIGLFIPQAFGWTNVVIRALFLCGSPVALLIASLQVFASTRYDYEGLDRILTKVKGWRKRRDLELNRMTYTSKVLETQPRLFSSAGYEIIVYKLQHESPAVLLSKIEELLRSVEDGTAVRYYTINSPASTSRQVQARIQNSEQYLSIEIIPFMQSAELRRRELTSLLEGWGERLSEDEVRKLARRIVSPLRKDYEWELKAGLFPSPIAAIHADAMIHFGDVEDRGLALSLARQPQKVGPDFQRYYGALSRLPGTLVVHIAGQPSRNPLAERYKQKLIAQTEGTDVEAARKLRSFSTNLRVSVSCMVNGTRSELEEIQRELDRVYALSDEYQRPRFTPENAFTDDLLRSMLPGSRTSLPHQRRFEIEDIREASRYIPWPSDAGSGEGAVLSLRTAANAIYGFKLFNGSPLYVWGKPGKGKSAFLSAIAINHLKNARDEQRDTAGFFMESGGTFAFLRDNLADLSLILEQDENGNWKPMPIHLLQYFFAFGDVGVEKARLWICETAKISDPEIMAEVSAILFVMRESGEFRMRQLYDRFAELRSGKQMGTAVHDSLTKSLTILRNFVALPQSQYGHIFDPAAAQITEFASLRVIYASQNPAPKEESELTTAFYNLALCAYQAFEVGFTPTIGKSSADLLVMIDELHNLFGTKALRPKQIRDLNSQGRKEGKKGVFSSQQLSDLVSDGINLIETMGHFLFAEAGPIDMLAETRQSLSDESRKEILREFEDALLEVNAIRARKKGYSWGYLDRNNEMHVLILDLTKEELWLIASDKPSRYLRNEVQRRCGVSYFEASRLLSIHGPATPPREESDLTLSQVEVICDAIRKAI